MFIIFLLLGCSVVNYTEKSFGSIVWGDLDKKNEEYMEKNVRNYCMIKYKKSCDDYSTCFVHVNSTFPGVVRSSSPGYISRNMRCQENNKNCSDYLMENIYNSMQYYEVKKNIIYMQYAYILYAHNSCALVSGDKTYDIDKYHKLIEMEIKCGKSKTLARYKNDECLK